MALCLSAAPLKEPALSEIKRGLSVTSSGLGIQRMATEGVMLLATSCTDWKWRFCFIELEKFAQVFK